MEALKAKRRLALAFLALLLFLSLERPEGSLPLYPLLPPEAALAREEERFRREIRALEGLLRALG
jgi:hypothetical protein